MPRDTPNTINGCPGGDPIDRTLTRTRLRALQPVFGDGARPEQVTDEAAELVVRNVQAVRQLLRLSLRQLAAETGYGDSTISETLANTYRGDRQSVILDLDRWAVARARRDSEPDAFHFVQTRVFRLIKTAAERAIDTTSISVVYGPGSSGVGKTTALKQIHAETPGSVYVSVLYVGGSTTGVLRLICREIRASGGCAYDLFSKLRSHFGEASGRLLLVDEAHNLFGRRGDGPFKALKDLLDHLGLPQLWAATDDVKAYLSRGVSAGEVSLTQIRSRIGLQRDLCAGDGLIFERPEVAQVLARWDPPLSRDAIDFATRLANVSDGGGLRTVKFCALNAAKLARRAGEDEVSGETMERAMSLSMETKPWQALRQRIATPATPRKTG